MTTSLRATQTLTAQPVDVYFGTYNKAGFPEGIFHAVFDLKTGRLSIPELAAAASDPTFIEIHPNSKFIYSVTERNPGAVSAFAIEPETKKLILINSSKSCGKAPCHLCVSNDGRTLLVANYTSGSVASIPINKDGSLSEPASSIQHTGSGADPKRQEGPHAHSINLSPDNRFAYAADLGLDKIMVYRLDSGSGRLLPNVPPEIKIKPGAGPRHFSFGPNGKFSYLINELDETIVAFAYDPKTGNLSEIQTISTLPESFAGISYCAEVRVHPNGKFLYGSNRGHDSIVTYEINPEKGTLTLLGFQNSGIKNPRNFNIDPTGRFCIVANQDSDTVIVFRINQETGLLESTDQVIKIPKPVCVRFVQQGSMA
ncbi:MAG: lactonase family protein [Lentisphaerae bacterium]|nr:lactonase family protein [Lentisphaerota bacterium]